MQSFLAKNLNFDLKNETKVYRRVVINGLTFLSKGEAQKYLQATKITSESWAVSKKMRWFPIFSRCLSYHIVYIYIYIHKNHLQFSGM